MTNISTIYICGHPDVSVSKFQNGISERLDDLGISRSSLAENMVDGRFDVAAEQQQLVAYDRIVLGFPLYWYGFPALMKQWFDDVFTPGFAYATGGDKMHGKEFMLFTTVGAPARAYSTTGFNNFTLDELLRPIQQSISYIGGLYRPPFVIHAAEFLTPQEIESQCDEAVQHFTKSFPTKRKMYADMIHAAEQLAIPLISAGSEAAE